MSLCLHLFRLGAVYLDRLRPLLPRGGSSIVNAFCRLDATQCGSRPFIPISHFLEGGLWHLVESNGQKAFTILLVLAYVCICLGLGLRILTDCGLSFLGVVFLSVKPFLMSARRLSIRHPSSSGGGAELDPGI